MSAVRTTATTVTAVLTRKFEVGPESIRPEATLASLDLDSLALAELALALQEEVGVLVAEDEVRKDTTVGELIAALDAKQAR